MIKQGFRKTGLYPLDSTAIDKSFIRPNPTATIQTEDPSLENVETTSNDTCKTCGRSTTNPLVKAGLVDKDLHDILVLGDITKSDKTNKKRLTGARIYTGQEMRDELKRKAEEQKEKEEGLKYRKEVREAKRIEKQNVIKMKQSKRKAKSTKISTEGRKINKKSNQSEEKRQHVDPHIIAVTAEVHADIETTEESDILEKIQLCRPRVRKANKQFRETEVS